MEIHDADGPAVATNSPHVEHRYLYGAAVDEILASENAAGAILWGLGDHEGTILDQFTESECRNYFQHCGYRHT